jgi:hypothetical protein
MNNQNPPVKPATDEEGYDFLLKDDIVPSGMNETQIYIATISRAYIESRGTRCINPKCYSRDLSAGSYYADDDFVVFDIKCATCGSTWGDGHALAFVTDVVLPEEQDDDNA